MQWLVIFIKKVFRNWYYFFFNDITTTISNPDILRGLKWIINKNYGRAYYKGYYEPEIVKIISDGLNEKSIFIDIGAHAGYFSLIATQIATKGRVISFEPLPRNYQYIMRIRDLNSINNWDVYPNAISNLNGALGLSLGETSSTASVVEKNSGTIDIQAITLDQFIEQHSIFPDFIKIDVEGHGDKVLEGLSILKDYPKKLQILMEIHPHTGELKYIQENLMNEDLEITNLKDQNTSIRLEQHPEHVLISNKLE